MSKFVSVIIPAAGSGSRMNSDVKKQFLKVREKEVIIRTIEKFENCELVNEIIIVTSSEDIQKMEDIIKKYRFTKIKGIVQGGKERQNSIYNGLKELSLDSEIVLVHDGARPFIEEATIELVIEEVKKGKSTIVAVPVKDTIKKIDCNGKVKETLKRESLWSVQTPQGFEKDILINAYEYAIKSNYIGTDDSSLVEHFGESVYFIEGSYDNIKITTVEDLLIANVLAKTNEEKKMRVGIGYDVHKLVPNRKLIIGGVNIPHELGLLGHSDADVLLHAIMDSILGAIGEGDIGQHFPDTSNEFEGISSLLLLEKVMKLVSEKSFEVNNLDCIIIAQSPKMLPFLEEMKNNISRILKINKMDVNIKATTTEKLGYIGRKEGIAAEAVVTITNK